MPLSILGPVFRWDRWSFEPAEWRLLNAASETIPLPNKTLDLLALLLDRAPALVTKDDILAKVWGGAIVEEGNIAFHVAALRKTLDRDTAHSCIETVRGRGYRFVAQVTRVDANAALNAPAAEIGATTASNIGARVWLVAALILAVVVGGLAWWSAASATPVVKVAPTEAAALVLEGRNLWRLRTPADVQQSIHVLERAVAADKNYAPAYAALADAYNLTMSGLPPTARYERAKANAERAVALDPGSAEGHTSLGFLRYKFEWRWDDAATEFKRAIALNPNYALAHHWYGEMLGLLGRYDESIAELHAALALEPESLAIQSDLVQPLLGAKRVAEARQVIENAARTNPAWQGIPFRMSEVLAAEGRERESLEERWRWMLLIGGTFDAVDQRRSAYRAGGMPAVLRVEIASLLAAESAKPGTWQAATNLSRAYAQLGDHAEAIRWISVALDRREDAAMLLPTSRDYDRLRGDAAFNKQLARIGLAPLHAK